jgi:glycosyltransferase involved in cell wall biosynthesis
MTKSDSNYSLTIIVPCYNEESTVVEVLTKLNKINIKDVEIIVVDDASKDSTSQILNNEAKNLYTKLIIHDVNMGKGASINSALKIATKDLVIIQDADLEYSPEDIVKLMEPIKTGLADVVYGSRFMQTPIKRVLPFWHTLVNKLLTILSNSFTNLNLTDMETCYKLFKRELLSDIIIKEKGFGVEPELTAKIAKTKAIIYEVPISYNPRSYAEGKKIKWTDGVHAIYCILRYSLFK